jgi:Domain of unknown function (DUF6265)
MISRLACSVVLLGALTVLAGAQAPRTPIDRLDWLSGCWARSRPDGVVEEHWMKPAGGTMLGMGRTVRGGRTVDFEFLQIREVDGRLAYVAKPSGQPENTFAQKSVSDVEVVFEDLAHDFPQRIIYRRNADGSLTARIEGTTNGQVRSVEFPYTRCS